MVGLPNFFEAILSTLSAMAVGSSGIFPALILEAPNKLSLNEIVLNRWLCFATGSLLGEVFLHLLPESVDSLLLSSSAWALAILTGILVFFATEMVAGFYENLQLSKTGKSSNDLQIMDSPRVRPGVGFSVPRAVGYLNLLANSIDNFSHGLSLGASYSVSIRCGLIATTCLLIHEIPHEISDFIILLRSGFSRRGAIKAQLLTASTCLIGTYTLAIFRWKFKDWMLLLPFTAGGFLYIALVSLLPTFLQEKTPRESFIQLCFMLLGVVCIQGLACVHFLS